jgi:hypothetical protein
VPLLALLFLTVAHAADPAEDVAARAQVVHEAHCADVAGADDAGAARAIGDVSDAWEDVARVHEETGATWLLYWRGLLAQCIGQNERATAALTQFVDSESEDPGMATMVRDARRRLTRLGQGKTGSPPASPPANAPTIAAGIALVLTASGTGVGGGVGLSQLSATRAGLVNGLLTTEQADTLIAQGDGQMAASIGLFAGALASGIASAAAFGSASSAPSVGVLVAPTDHGVVAVLGGRW